MKHIRNNHIMLSIVVISIFLLLTTIIYASDNPAGGVQSTPAPLGEIKDVEISKIELVPYTAKSRRDPFASIIVTTKAKMEKKKKSLNPLENFDVTDFKLMGIIYDGKRYYASVVLPDNKAYTLKAGMNAGLYGGKVAKITNDAIIFNEYVVDYLGVKQLKKTELKLRKEEEQ